MQKKIGRGRGARTKEILESKQCGTSKSVICISMYFAFLEGNKESFFAPIFQLFHSSKASENNPKW